MRRFICGFACALVCATAAPVAAAPLPAAPESSPLGLAIGAKLGGTMPTSKLKSTYSVGVDAAYRLPFFARLLSVGADFSYAQPRLAGSGQSVAAGTYTYALNQRILALAVEVFATIPVGAVSAYGGLGYGIYFLRATTTTFGNVQTASQTRGGMHVRAGSGYAVGPGDIFAELRWDYTALRFQETGASNAGGVNVAAGYRLAL